METRKIHLPPKHEVRSVLEDAAEELVRVGKLTIEEGGHPLMAIITLSQRKDTSLFLVSYESDDLKGEVFSVMRHEMQRSGVIGFAFCAESWYVKKAKDESEEETNYTSPSQHPNRKESLSLLMLTSDWGKIDNHSFHREKGENGKEIIVWEEKEKEEISPASSITSHLDPFRGSFNPFSALDHGLGAHVHLPGPNNKLQDYRSSLLEYRKKNRDEDRIW